MKSARRPSLNAIPSTFDIRRSAFRFISGATLAGSLLFAAAGCGDTPPPPKGAADQIHDARDLIDEGDALFARRDYEGAKVKYNSAKSTIEEGRPKAREAEVSAINSLADSVRQKIDDAELKAITDKKVEVKPVVTEVQKEDAAEAKQKAEAKAKADAEAKKSAKAEADLEKALARKDQSGSKKDDEPATPAATVASGEKKAGANGDAAAAGGDENAKPQSDVIVPGRAPFKDITSNSPEVQIVKIATKGTFVYAYFYVYNKSEDDRRVNTINGFFKDKDNQTLIDHTTTFPFDGFKTDTHKDMIGEQVTDALTLGSDVIPGLKAHRYVVIGEHATRAKDCKKVAVQVVFDNGNPLVESGP